MGAQLPLWLQVIAIFATPILGVAVGIVAFLQWQIGKRKLALDVFERRLKIYD
jgi:hypothetical protein